MKGLCWNHLFIVWIVYYIKVNTLSISVKFFKSFQRQKKCLLYFPNIFYWKTYRDLKLEMWLYGISNFSAKWLFIQKHIVKHLIDTVHRLLSTVLNAVTDTCINCLPTAFLQTGCHRPALFLHDWFLLVVCWHSACVPNADWDTQHWPGLHEVLLPHCICYSWDYR